MEVPCLVDATGVDPVHVGELPPQLAALNRTYLNVCELTVKAALEGRPELVRHAAMLDPNAAGDAVAGPDLGAVRRAHRGAWRRATRRRCERPAPLQRE